MHDSVLECLEVVLKSDKSLGSYAYPLIKAQSECASERVEHKQRIKSECR